MFIITISGVGCKSKGPGPGQGGTANTRISINIILNAHFTIFTCIINHYLWKLDIVDRPLFSARPTPLNYPSVRNSNTRFNFQQTRTRLPTIRLVPIKSQSVVIHISTNPLSPPARHLANRSQPASSSFIRWRSKHPYCHDRWLRAWWCYYWW